MSRGDIDTICIKSTCREDHAYISFNKSERGELQGNKLGYVGGRRGRG